MPLGWTQHSKGVQIIRTAAILQFLLGNIGRPGGGILALRGHASIQGSTDIPTLYDIFPGYLPMPRATVAERTRCSDYLDTRQNQLVSGDNSPAYFISLAESVLRQKRDARKTTSDTIGFRRSPGTIPSSNTSIDMADGKMEGLFVMGQNPAVAGAKLAVSAHSAFQT